MTAPHAAEPASGQVAVVGGGIAGLAAALRLRALDSTAAITVLESSARLGGKIAGDIVDGCVVDGGADVCIGDKLRSTRMFDDLALRSRAIQVNPNGLPTFELRDGRLQRMPPSFAGELLTFRGGMQELVDVVCDALRDITVETEYSATGVQRDGARWKVERSDGESHLADAVIVALPVTEAARLLIASGVSTPSMNELRALACPATSTVTMAWRATDVPHPLDGTGYLVADARARVSACTWTSSKNPSHAPPGTALLRGYIRGTSGDPVALVRSEVATVLGITAPPLFARIYEWSAGIPVYTATHEHAVRDLIAALANAPGLFIAGSTFHGVGIPDCILSGERAATGAMSYLLARQTEEAA